MVGYIDLQNITRVHIRMTEAIHIISLIDNNLQQYQLNKGYPDMQTMLILSTSSYNFLCGSLHKQGVCKRH